MGLFDGKNKKSGQEIEEVVEVKEQENANVVTEMEGAPLNEQAPVNADAAEAADTRVWKLEDGTECSKSAFIREQFLKANMSRKDISEKFDIPYRTVYGATVNMENAAEPTGRGRGVTFSKIKVTAEGVIVTEKDGVVYLNNVAQPEGTVAPETVEADRNTWIKDQVAAGVNRGDIAKALDLSYGVVYGLTKEAEGTRQKYEIEVVGEDGIAVNISRSEYIRRQVAAGVSKADIAKELGVEYSVVWQATKKMKTTEERFAEAVASLEKFMDAVDAPETLTAAIAMLNGLAIKAEANTSTEDVEVTPEA